MDNQELLQWAADEDVCLFCALSWQKIRNIDRGIKKFKREVGVKLGTPANSKKLKAMVSALGRVRANLVAHADEEHGGL